VPLVPKPLLRWHHAVVRSELQTSTVEDANLGHDWKATNGLAVDVTGDVSDALAPDHGLDLLQAVLSEDRMDSRPADLRVPEPQGPRRVSMFRPCFDVRLVPFR